MSVLIKGMQIPKNCSDCPLNYDMMSCMITGTRWWSDTMVLMGFDCQESRLYDCPLIPLPEHHGRLIDERVAYDKIAEQEGGYYMDMDGVDMGLQETPTVIDAEE